MQITIDGTGGNSDKLNNKKIVENLLDTYPEEIGMTKISVPYVIDYRGANPKDWGISGFVLIAESHIAIHTFPEHKQVWVDIFSCKGFDENPAISTIIKTFELGKARIGRLKRGLEYPSNKKSSVDINLEERELIALKNL